MLFLALPHTHELLLFGGGLEAAMAKLRGSVDELGNNLLQLPPLGWTKKGLSDGDDTLLWPDNSTFDHQVVLIHFTIVWEAAHRCNALLSEIKLSRGIVVNKLAVLLTHSLALRNIKERTGY